MNRSEKSQDNQKTLLSNGTVVLIFTMLMAWAIFYFYESEPDVKRNALHLMAKELSDGVTKAHWQWQAEGRPEIIMLVYYSTLTSSSGEAVETDRRAIRMNGLGRPSFEKSNKGCATLWKKMLNAPLTINGFKVTAQYYSDEQKSEQLEEAFCRYRLSTGAYFDYKLLSGRTTEIQD